jgi:hypothetical protein
VQLGKPVLSEHDFIDRQEKRFATSARIRDELNFWGHVSVRIVNRRLNEQRKGAHKTTATVITYGKCNNS